MFWLNISVAATKYIIIKEIFSKVNCRFNIAMFLRMPTYAQKWLNSYVFYTSIIHGNIMTNQFFAPKLPLKKAHHIAMMGSLFYFKISLTLFWIIVGL